jgi:4-hydroxybenzoate polyprenyltransferase
MVNFKHWMQLIRWKNLLFLAYIVTAVYYGVVIPYLAQYHIALPLEGVLCALLVLSTVFIAAGGYAINDYFDTKIDEINKPTKVLVGRHITRNQAAKGFQILLVIGLLCGIGIAVLLRDVTIGMIYMVISGLLWFYSSSYKRQLIIGNLMIALCAFMTCFMVGYVVNIQLTNHFTPYIFYTPIITDIYAWTAGFGLFSFLFTLLREIIKDIDDIEGDREMECHTIPIVWGITCAKGILIALSVVILLLTGYFAYALIPFAVDTITLKYYISGLLIPMLILIFWIGKAQKRRQWQQISDFVKFIMLIGCSYALFVGYLFYINGINA